VFEALHGKLDIEQQGLLGRVEGHPGTLEQKANIVHGADIEIPILELIQVLARKVLLHGRADDLVR
jgi:hypothetical protein